MPSSLKYKVCITDEALLHIQEHKNKNKKLYQKINKFIEELREHPLCGTGKVEPLRHNLSGFYSRRINKFHRLIYKIDEEKKTVIIISAFGHFQPKHFQPTHAMWF